MARKRQRDEQAESKDPSKRLKNEGSNGDHKSDDSDRNENNQNTKNHHNQNGTSESTRVNNTQEENRRREPLTDVLIPPSR